MFFKGNSILPELAQIQNQIYIQWYKCIYNIICIIIYSCRHLFTLIHNALLLCSLFSNPHTYFIPFIHSVYNIPSHSHPPSAITSNHKYLKNPLLLLVPYLISRLFESHFHTTSTLQLYSYLHSLATFFCMLNQTHSPDHLHTVQAPTFVSTHAFTWSITPFI